MQVEVKLYDRLHIKGLAVENTLDKICNQRCFDDPANSNPSYKDLAVKCAPNPKDLIKKIGGFKDPILE